MTAKVAYVAVENAIVHFDHAFSYRIPGGMNVQPGCRVAIPFGRGNAKRQGIVLSVGEEEQNDLKAISELLDPEPILNDEMIRMCGFMKSHCFCTYYDAVRAMLPAGINYRLSLEYSVSAELGDRFYDLPDEQRRIVTIIRSKNNKVEKHALLQELGYADSAVLDEMEADGILVKNDTALRKVGDKTIKMMRLSDDAETLLQGMKLSEKQESVVDLLSTVGSASVKEVCYYTGVTTSVPDTLVRKGIAVYFDDEVFRVPKYNVSAKRDVTLTDEQQKAYDELSELYEADTPEVSLLYGITGSGKTSVFFKLIERAFDDGKDVIVMVPEIALTPQMIAMFRAHFGDKVAVFHSALSLGERLDEYKRVSRGIAKIAIGTRSAIFAPFKDLGLIIMDEEQEHTYKSESKPRFNAKELAKFRCSYHKALLLFSSATPSVETYYYANEGRYHKHTLTKRYGTATLPDVIIADMNEEIAIGNTGSYSNVLLQNIEENLDTGRQSILLLNRRGYNSYVCCNSCREPLSCPNCSITLTYHSANNRLMCHYCGYSIPYQTQCPACGSHSLRLRGTGTQRAEVEIAEIFPHARILRMDTDTTMTRSSHEKKLTAFANGEYDILIGTQMVAKGLDFPNVTLVGVLNADHMLYLDDYRSFENTFSLLTQVVGRSGRGNNKGRAIIQTYTPENPIISLAARQDYDAFYASEIGIRKAMLYPPFASICLIGFVGENTKLTEGAAFAFTRKMTELLKTEYTDIPLRVLGPSQAAVFKVSNKYRYKLILKCRNDNRFRDMIGRMLVQFSSIREFSSVTVYADMDPLNL
ncbi:MAG: primosomal protein N' [Ruminococcus sp.]|uniref:replication restart helicase PriA n=1 Tax=Ruminococcus sp. TaxID=41978 RepID=UPI002872AECB|nr:primosomal protein N' [Ruminococcus sp.]MBQ3285956.1 primosomal protein N' [Ruminococcus sp.]